MNDVDGRTAAEALARSRKDTALGARSAARPWWYHPALGVCMFLALASFSLDAPAIGVPLGLVVGPVALEMLARQRTGAAPLQQYADPSVRGVVIPYVLAVLALGGAGIALEKGAELTGAAAVSGAIILVVTIVVGRLVDRRRTAGPARRAHG